MATTLHSTLTSTSSTDMHSFGLSPTAAMTPPQRSPWHSPVPYLFGGLAAMLGLIAFALLILACSYWRLSTDNDEQQSDEDLEKGEGISKLKNPPVYEEKIVVIMAGNDVPTFLANPAQIFLNPTPNQDLVVASVSKDDDEISTTITTVVVVDDDDDKPKEDENVQHHN